MNCRKSMPISNYTKYFISSGNCIDECIAIVLGEKCNCTFFYMPREDEVRICNNDPDSVDFKCIRQARIDLQATLKCKCGHCDILCEDNAYRYETAVADLMNVIQLWTDQNHKVHGKDPLSWAHNKMSVIHIFFGSETTAPRLRKRHYGTTDLIANTAGILGVCLGFSILSVVQVVYFMTLRSFRKYFRRGRIGDRISYRFSKRFKTAKYDRKITHVNVKPNKMLV